MTNKEKNADRFTGFADLYENARPSVPEYPVRILCAYLGRTPDTVVDLGCGTGLSTAVWQSVAHNVVGIEPSGDMLAGAQRKNLDHVRFIQAFSDDTTLPDRSADIVVCSQSFHWMEPTATLREVNRILKPGGVFATIDCDWPPVTLWQAEKAYMTLYEKVREIERDTPEISGSFHRYDKENHLKNIRESGYFRYARELVFANTEKCTAERLIGILLSQGSLQAILKRIPERIESDIAVFSEAIRSLFGGREFEIDFCYRMRVGIK